MSRFISVFIIIACTFGGCLAFIDHDYFFAALWLLFLRTEMLWVHVHAPADYPTPAFREEA